MLWDELSPWENANEALTGVAVIPVSVIGPVPISLGRYELREPDGAVVENGREAEDVYVPLAHTEGGLGSLYRGARRAAESGGFRTYVLQDRITRALLRLQVGGRRTRARALAGGRAAGAAGVAPRAGRSLAVEARASREVKTHVVGPIATCSGAGQRAMRSGRT